MILLAALGVCASLAMNLLVQFGLGLGILADRDAGLGPGLSGAFSRKSALMGAALLTIALFFLWIFFTYVLAPLGIGFYWYLLLYPLSVALMKGLEQLYKRFLPGSAGAFFPLPSGSTEFLPLGRLISLHLALHPHEALVLALCLSLGVYLSLMFLQVIRRRSSLEAVPPFLRHTPLSLLSLGLLSLIFTAASLMFFNLFRIGKIG
jgi:electron transport complex protein RnfA